MPDKRNGQSGELKSFYVSLSRSLYGYYVRFDATSEEVVRQHVMKYYDKLWCNIYSEAYFREIIRKRYPRDSRVINMAHPAVLTSPDGSWE